MVGRNGMLGIARGYGTGTEPVPDFFVLSNSNKYLQFESSKVKFSL